MTSLAKAQLIAQIIDDAKGEQIETLDVHDKTSIADYFVICSGLNDRHMAAIADRVSEGLLDLREKPLRTEGDKGGWILQDYGDVILHIMRDEQRQFYDLESFWKNMRPSPDVSP